MANDAAITQTNRDFLSGSSLMVPMGLVFGGACFYLWSKESGASRARKPSDDNITLVIIGSLIAVGAVAGYRMLTHPKTTSVSGELPEFIGAGHDHWTFKVQSKRDPNVWSSHHGTWNSYASTVMSPEFQEFANKGRHLRVVNLQTNVEHPYHRP